MKKKSYKIEVKAVDIKKGIRNNTKTCAISRAALRLFRGKDVSTSRFTLTVQNGETMRFMLPKRAQDFITRFNAGQLVKPFSFTVKVEQE